MKHEILKRTVRMMPLALCFAVAVLPGTASAEDHPWQVRFAAVSVNPSGSSVNVPETGEQISYESTNGVGFAIDLEYRASRRLGIDFGFISASPGVEIAVDAEPLAVIASSDITTNTIYAALNIHLLPDSRFDLYVGPMFAYVIYNSFNLVAGPGVEEAFSTQNDLAIGAVLGLDIGIGDSRWSINTAVRYLDTTLEAIPEDGGVGKTDVDPTIFSVGFGYRF